MSRNVRCQFWLLTAAVVIAQPLIFQTAHADLITHLKFDSSPGSINGINGSFVGDAQLTTGGSGISGEALIVDGDGDYVSYSHPTAGTPVLGTLTSFSVSMWINTSQINDDFDRLLAVFGTTRMILRAGTSRSAQARAIIRTTSSASSHSRS